MWRAITTIHLSVTFTNAELAAHEKIRHPEANTDELPTSILLFRLFVFSEVLCNAVNNHHGLNNIKASNGFIFILTSKGIQ